MMKKKLKKLLSTQAGFGVISFVILLLIISSAGAVGYYNGQQEIKMNNEKLLDTTLTGPSSKTTRDTTEQITQPTSAPNPEAVQPSTTPSVYKPDCVTLNNNEQVIVDSALNYSYEYYLMQKDNDLSDSSNTDSMKEANINAHYTTYRVKVENWQGDVNRTIQAVGCTSTVIAKLQPR